MRKRLLSAVLKSEIVSHAVQGKSIISIMSVRMKSNPTLWITALHRALRGELALV